MEKIEKTYKNKEKEIDRHFQEEHDRASKNAKAKYERINRDIALFDKATPGKIKSKERSTHIDYNKALQQNPDQEANLQRERSGILEKIVKDRTEHRKKMQRTLLSNTDTLERTIENIQNAKNIALANMNKRKEIAIKSILESTEHSER